MRSLSFDENIVRLILNFLSNRTQCVKFSGCLSDYKSASRIFTPDLCHTYRLDFLSVPLFNYFNFSRCAKHFERRNSNRLHPLFTRIIVPISRDLPMPRMYVRKFPKPRSGWKSFSILHEIFNNGNIVV